MSNKQLRKSRIPFLTVSTLIAITTYISLWAWNKVLSLVLSHYYGREIYLLPYVFGKAEGVPLLLVPVSALIGIYGWLLSTRVKQFKTRRMRVMTFFNMLIALAGVLAGLGITKVHQYVLPFFYERLGRVIDTSDAVNQALFEQTKGFFFMLVMLPLIVMLFISFFLVTKYRLHDEELKKAFFVFQWRGERLRKFEKMGEVEEEVIPLPDVELGISKRTNEMVILPGHDRTLNTIIIGSIGTGKTAALALPIINQDLHYITRFMNDFPTVSKRDDYISKDVQGRYLNGLTVVEPSNDLCKKVYQLAKAHGIPDEAITYIDPTNPNTPSINVMQGPTEKVAEVFAQVLDGLQDNGGTSNFYFEQAQRNHLKMHIYLLKMHDPSIEVTFDMLIDMYNDTNLVHEMHMKLKKRFPSNFEEIEDRDTYNYWQILKGVDKWFDNVVVPLQVKTSQGLQKVRDDNGNLRYIDALEQDVKGLRNILNDIGNNPLIRRVLFGKSNFNFDAHMGGAGGILLVNTAKGELSELSGVLGKIILMSVQNAAFRREPYTSTYHHIVVDEAPEYLYSGFASFPAQSRKYKVIITTLQQTLTQLRGAFGEDYMNTVVAAMRNRMVYADVSAFDAKYFAEMFGEKEVYREGESEQSVSPLQENPITRTGSTYSKVREARLSGSDILYQEAFECAVKIVVDNQTMPVEQIKANFVPEEEFKHASVQVNPDVIDFWIEKRYTEYPTNKELIDINVVENIGVNEVPKAESGSKDIQDGQEHEHINLQQMERAINIMTPSKPKEDVRYVKPNLAAVTVPYLSEKNANPLNEYPGNKIQRESEGQHEFQDTAIVTNSVTPEPLVTQKLETEIDENVVPLEEVTVPKKTKEIEIEQTVEEYSHTPEEFDEVTLPRRPKQQSIQVQILEDHNALGNTEQYSAKMKERDLVSEPNENEQKKRNHLDGMIEMYEEENELPEDVEDFFRELKKG